MIAGLHIIDFFVLIGYLLGITVLGIWVGRGATNAAEFFMPRRFGKAMMMMNAFGTGTASDQAVTVASGTFRSGLSGIWYQWVWLFVTPFYWLVAPIFRRLRAVTTADVYELRFDKSVSMLFAVVGIASLAVKTGLLLKGTGALMEASTDGAISAEIAIFGTAILFVTYGVLGGLAGAIVTDFVQGFLILAFSFMLLPLLWFEVGGLTGIQDAIDNPAMLSLVAPGKITTFYVVMMGIQALVGIVAQPFFMGICGAGKTEFEGRVGVMVGNFVKRICTIAWCLTAIAGVAWYIQDGVALDSVDPDNVYGDIAQTFLPRMLHGFLGLFLAAMLAGVMSSCDAYMLSAAALFTQNIYQHAVPNRGDTHYLRVGRIASLVVVIGGILFALWVPNVIKALEIWFMIAPMMGIALWLGLFWRRLTVWGAWASTLAGFIIWWVTTQSWFVETVQRLPFAEGLRMIWITGDQATIYLPWQIVAYMSAAISIGIVVSLVTPRVAKERLDRFYALTRTPIGENEVLTAPCTLPHGATTPDRAMIFNKFDFEIPMPSRTSVVGFVLGWGVVGAMILLFMLPWR